jgi:hypothetical protein
MLSRPCWISGRAIAPKQAIHLAHRHLALLDVKWSIFRLLHTAKLPANRPTLVCDSLPAAADGLSVRI